MIPLQPFTIAGYKSGLQTDRKPFLLPEQAFPTLNNAYCWRERIKKRECLELVGRLRRLLVAVADGTYTTVIGTNTFNIFLGLGVTITEPNASIESGLFENITIAFGAPINQSLTDIVGTGILTVVGAGPITSAIIDYATGIVTITASAAVGPAPVLFTGAYFPGLPVMGIESRELSNINNEQTLFFDTTYVYTFDGLVFTDIPPYTWDGTDADFFWSTNYQGADSSIRTFFVTNFVDSPGSPIRFTQDAVTFTDFAPAVDTINFLLQARILIPYYGRLLAFNTIEGTVLGNPGNKNFFNRVRFSQTGNPLQVDAWRSDIFGKGGFADAPTAEQIISVVFFKNTLIVFFERSTWQLRYVGEYGTPFLFERISSDFGSESTFSPTLFDQGVLSIGDRAITVSSATSVQRIDETNPDLVFEIKNTQGGPQRVQGIRDFQRELVFWNFNDSDVSSTDQFFPNKVIVYNYRNQTFALFRDNVTVFGVLQPAEGITWDSNNVFWDDADVTWDEVANFALFPRIVIGNQSGYIHYYGYQTPDDVQNFIQAIDLTTTPITITVPNHNFVDDEIVFITGLMFVDTGIPPSNPVATDLNDKIYLVKFVDVNTLSLFRWDFASQVYINNFPFTPATTAFYVGGGQIALFPKLDVQTKDFNPYTEQGKQIKITYIDFLTDATQNTSMSVNLFANTYLAHSGNINVGNRESEIFLQAPYYGNNAVIASDIAWHRFYSTLIGQMIRIQMTYDDDLMNTLTTHQQTWILNAITIYTRIGGKLIF